MKQINQQKKINISHIRDMVSIAYIDGVLHEKEISTIKKIGFKLGLTQSELDEIIAKPEKILFHPPQNLTEKKEHLIHLIEVIFADSKIKDEEIELYYIISQALGFSEDLTAELLEIYIDQYEKKDSVLTQLLLNQPLVPISKF